MPLFRNPGPRVTSSHNHNQIRFACSIVQKLVPKIPGLPLQFLRKLLVLLCLLRLIRLDLSRCVHPSYAVARPKATVKPFQYKIIIYQEKNSHSLGFGRRFCRSAEILILAIYSQSNSNRES